MIVIDNSLLENITSLDIKNMSVPYGPNMFLETYKFIATDRTACVAAVGDDGTVKAVLRNEQTSYTHMYKKTGFLDLWFLEQYDCIFLHDCNEYACIILQEALAEWNGKKIVLVGENWENMIPYLNFPSVEINYEKELTPEATINILDGINNPLHIMYGLPHNEPLDRLSDGIMYYDEIMALSYMFSDYISPGSKNSDKQFVIIDLRVSNLGLFALLGTAKKAISYIKARGYIPVMHITKSANSFYSDFEGDEIWDKFFYQPEGYSYGEAMQSKNVYLTPGFYNARVLSYIFDLISIDDEGNEISPVTWPNGLYNKQIEEYVEARMQRFLPYPEQTLGVLARGTDYVNTKLANHAVHASKEMICEKIDAILRDNQELKYIYLATEDASYCEYFKQRYGDKITFTDQDRYIVREGEKLTELHNRERADKKGFDYGAEYVASITLLSRCNRLVASGSCAGVGEAVRMNGGKYTDVFVFELGCN